MIKAKQIEMTKKVQDKFYSFFNPYKSVLSLPAFKALCDISRGILASGSVIINQGAVKLAEKTTPKKTAERFYRNTRREGLSVNLRPFHMQRQCRYFNHETLIIVDESDIVKPHATRMEGLNKVRDGSTGRNDQLGYDLLNFIAYQKQDNGYRMLPVSSDLYSDSMETDSIINLLHDRIDEITIYGHNQGVFVFDRGFDSRINISHLVENQNSFIIRGVGKRNLIIDEEERPFQEVCRSVPLVHCHSGMTRDQHFHCGLQRVRVRTTPYPKKKAESVELWLVVARYESFHQKGYFYFLCDFPNQNLTEDEIISKTLNYYRLRWKIEQSHRQLKQDYKWESMQLMSYEGLKNLNMIFWISISFLYACKEYILLWAKAFPREFGQYRKKLSKLFDFVYSALMKAVKSIFENWSKYDNGSPNKEPAQLLVSFF
jgi:hypothetical protein